MVEWWSSGVEIGLSKGRSGAVRCGAGPGAQAKAGQKQAKTSVKDESFIHQDLFCMPRAHSRNSQSRAEQARQSRPDSPNSPDSPDRAEQYRSTSPFHAPAPEGISCITPHRELPDGGPHLQGDQTSRR